MPTTFLQFKEKKKERKKNIRMTKYFAWISQLFSSKLKAEQQENNKVFSWSLYIARNISRGVLWHIPAEFLWKKGDWVIQLLFIMVPFLRIIRTYKISLLWVENKKGIFFPTTLPCHFFSRSLRGGIQVAPLMSVSWFTQLRGRETHFDL